MNRISRFGFRISAKLLATGGFCGMIAVGLNWTLQFTGDYLPVMRSDLDFFPKMIADKQVMFRKLHQRLLCPGDAGVFSDLKNTLLFAGISIWAEVMILLTGRWKVGSDRGDDKES